MRARAAVAVLMGLLPVLVAVPVAAQTGGGSGATPVTPTVGSMLPDLDQLTGDSIAAGIQNPDAPYEPLNVTTALGPNGTAGQEEMDTRLVDAVLTSEVVVSVDGVRGVASTKASICPTDRGKVSGTVRLSIIGVDEVEHVLTANLNGTVNDRAELTSSVVDVGTAKGQNAAALTKFGMQLLKNAESAWKRGYCVKIDVSEGQSGTVQPGVKVKIAATAKPRFGGGNIKGPMTAALTRGQKKVAPASSSDSPARFVYSAPTHKPGSGKVELRSVSRRGIGTADLEYMTQSDYKLEGTEPFGHHVSATKCDGLAGKWTLDFTMGGATPTNVSFVVPTEPEPGAPVGVTTPQVIFRQNINGRETGGEVDVVFLLTFYADGKESPLAAPGGHPAAGFFIGNPGAVTLSLKAGDFCKGGGH